MSYLQWLRASPVARRWQQGQGLVEYALILVLVAVVVILAVILFGDSLANYYQYAIDELGNVM